jgi:hypothetical protein
MPSVWSSNKGSVGWVTAVACLSALLTGCGGSGEGGLRSFQGQGLAFRYPKTWEAHTYKGDFNSFSTVLVYLSNEPLRRPYVISHGHGYLRIDGRQPLTRLQAHSILAWWESDGRLGGLPAATGQPVVVGGRHGTLQTNAPGCPPGANTTLAVTVPIPHSSDNWNEFVACSGSSSAPELKRQVTSLLSTVRFVKS